MKNFCASKVNAVRKMQKHSRKDAKPQRAAEKFLCVIFSSLRFCGRFFPLLCLLPWLFFSTAFASDSAKHGTINGIVLDRATQAPLRGIHVRLLNTNRGTTTGTDGRFTITKVPVGNYDLIATAVGYAAQRRENLTVSENALVEVKLELAEAPIPLQEVVVTPGHYAIMSAESAVRQSLTGDDVKNIPQFGEDIYRAIRRLPGISASDYSARFTVRGGFNREVLVLLDGLELYEPFHLKDVYGGALSIIDLNAISDIQLMTGGFPVEFGNKLSGVFNIVSAQPSAGRRPTALGLSFSNARVLAERSFAGEKGSWLISARRGYLDLVLKMVDPESGFRPTYYDAYSKVQYRWRDRHTLTASLLYAGDKVNFKDSEDDGDFAQTRYGNAYAWLNLKSIFSPKIYAQSVLAYGHVDQNRRGSILDDGEILATVRDERDLNIFNFKQDWSLALADRHLLKWGLQLDHFTSHYDYFNRERYERERTKAGTIFDYDTTATQLQPQGNELGIYLANRTRLTSNLTAEIGLRYDRVSYTNDSPLSPRLHLAYAFGRQTMLRLAWGRFRQAQGLHELDLQDGDARFYPAELADHSLLSLEHQLTGGLYFRLEAYHKRLNHIRPRHQNLSAALEFFPEAIDDRVRLEPARGSAKGIEIFLKQETGGKLSWWGSYAYAVVEEEILGKEVPRPFDQRHTIYVDASYRPSANWRFNLAWQYRSGWPYTRVDFEPVEQPDGGRNYRKVFGTFHGARYPAFHSLDVKINRYFNTARGQVALFLEIINFYNHENVRNYDYFLRRLPTGEVVATRLVETWFPLLPSLGVSWEF
jgi:outer membrane receptor protein involved in Fe transport